MRKMPRLEALGVTVALVVLTACGGSDGTEAGSGETEAGQGSPLTLQMAHIDGGTVLDPAVEWFAERVGEVSSGQLEIEVALSCCGRNPDVEEQLVESVAAGDFDLGWVGTRVFADLGVTTFQALTAPLLLDSYALQEVVITSDIPAEMLDGLEPLDVVGVAVLPGALRKPISAGGPLVAPADWQGITFHAFHSTDSADAITALGATPTDVGFDARDEGLFDGSIHGIENSIVYHAEGRQSPTPYVTVNVNLWPRISALLANPGVLSELSETQIGWLHEAAADVAARTGELADLDAAVLADSCQAGARYAEAIDAELTALADALAPVYARLEEDPKTKAFIERIREREETVDAEDPLVIPNGCTGVASTAEAGTDDPSVLNGVYESADWTVEGLVTLGVDQRNAENSAGVFTFTFQDGRFELRHQSAQGGLTRCDGAYSIAGDQVTVDVEPGGCGPGGQFFTATFELSADNLRLNEVVAGHPSDIVLFGTEPWTKID